VRAAEPRINVLMFILGSSFTANPRDLAGLFISRELKKGARMGKEGAHPFLRPPFRSPNSGLLKNASL